MFKLVKRFLDEDDGAVTVDWVVLTAALVALVAAITAAMQTNVLSLSDSVTTFLSSWTF